MPSRSELRQHCRNARAALDVNTRNSASHAITAHLAASAHFANACRVAIYWPIAHEVDLRGLLSSPSADTHVFYLPCMTAARTLEFRRFSDSAELTYNSWGIAEPPEEAGPPIATQTLDLVCVPLLGFDRSGNRLGQGGGFYDRTFAFRRERGTAGPLLIGTAFACQEVAVLEHAPWDVPLDAVVTEQGLIDCRPDAQRRNTR